MPAVKKPAAPKKKPASAGGAKKTSTRAPAAKGSRSATKKKPTVRNAAKASAAKKPATRNSAATKVRGKVKTTRLKVTGATTRMRGHSRASAARSQGRRDAR